MRVLMISIDKGLVGANPLGDVIERHKRYGEFVEVLDIIVLCKRGFKRQQWSERVRAYPTNSLSRWFYYIDGVRLGRKLFGKKGYDLIVTQDPFVTALIGLSLKRKFGAKLLIHFHGDFRRFLRSVINQADAVRVMSLGQKEYLVRAGVAADKICVISTPVEVARFEYWKDEEGAVLDSSNRQLFEEYDFVLMVGRKDRVKDFDTLFRALNLVAERRGRVGLCLLGNYTAVEAYRNGLSPAVKLIAVPFVQTKDLPAYYRACRLTVLSSYSESFGKVLVEANASGRPVVATATTGAKEIVKDGHNGFLVNIGDAKALAEKIMYLLDRPEEAKQMGRRGQLLVREKFGDNTRKVINLWRELVK